jgi:homoserine dehydrogenase
VAILGFGTVGSAVARILCDQPGHSPLKLTHVFNRDVERKRVDWVGDDVRWSSDVEQILASDADVIVELVGGLEPAHDWISRALLSGKVRGHGEQEAHRAARSATLCTGPR